ncbi:hypothetical protein L6452_18048 [Arctium lappa]|uniref:Uncharacterized protein n=1 Tax=Arctium lappa TaxID=4217 RepID=A0ACB9C4Z9_ARCLA|nr:hypothetical protein L6452_18048 [Arctium lappa]
MKDLPEGKGGVVASSLRPRGRPPKPRDDLAPVSAPKEVATSVSGRKHGHSPKLGKPATAVKTWEFRRKVVNGGEGDDRTKVKHREYHVIKPSF